MRPIGRKAGCRAGEALLVVGGQTPSGGSGDTCPQAQERLNFDFIFDVTDCETRRFLLPFLRTSQVGELRESQKTAFADLYLQSRGVSEGLWGNFPILESPETTLHNVYVNPDKKQHETKAKNKLIQK